MNAGARPGDLAKFIYNIYLSDDKLLENSWGYDVVTRDTLCLVLSEGPIKVLKQNVIEVLVNGSFGFVFQHTVEVVT